MSPYGILLGTSSPTGWTLQISLTFSENKILLAAVWNDNGNGLVLNV